jgi:hypothetical protein
MSLCCYDFYVVKLEISPSDVSVFELLFDDLYSLLLATGLHELGVPDRHCVLNQPCSFTQGGDARSCVLTTTTKQCPVLSAKHAFCYRRRPYAYP